MTEDFNVSLLDQQSAATKGWTSAWTTPNGEVVSAADILHTFTPNDTNTTVVPPTNTTGTTTHGGSHPAELVALSIIMLLSTAGNIMVLYVVGRFLRFKTVTNVFIVSLALSDLATTLVCMPMTYASLVRGEWILGGDTCVLNGLLNAALGVVSTLMITFITVDRYYVVVKLPKGLINIKLASLVVAACWVLAGFFSFPWHLVVNSSDGDPDYYYTQGYHHCMYIFHARSSPDGALYSLVFMALSFFVPSAFVLYCTQGIWRMVRHNDSRVRPASTHASQLRFSGELRTAKTVLIIVIFFFICRAPYMIFGVAFAIAGQKMSTGLDTVALFLFWTSCAVNPVIYAVRNPMLAQALHLRRHTGYQSRESSGTLPTITHQHHKLPEVVVSDRGGEGHSFPDGAAGQPSAPVVNSSEISVFLSRNDQRSDSIPSVLLFSAHRSSRKDSTTTTSTNTTNL